MTARPDITFLDQARNEGELKTSFFGPMLDNGAETPGRGAMTELTIAAGAIAPPAQASRQFSVDTELDAASDDLTSIDQTNSEDGAWILIRNDTDGRDVVVKHGAGGSGQILLADNQDLTLDDTAKSILLRREGTAWVEIGRFLGPGSYARKQATVVTLTDTGAPHTLTADDDGKTFLLDSSANPFTVNIDPVADLPNGWSVEFEMIGGGGRDGSGNRVTFDGNAAELVGIEATYEVLTIGHRGKLVNDGTQIRVTNEDLPEVMFRITATGAYTHTRPKGRQFAKEAGVTGGGGSGGRGGGTGADAGGGGAGATAIKYGWDISAVASMTGTVGTSGAGKTAAGNGNDGGDTTMTIPGTTLTGTGGVGGQGNTSGGNTGGNEVQATGGDLNLQGQAGFNSEASSFNGVGGASYWAGGSRGRASTPGTGMLGSGSGGVGVGNLGADGGDGIAWVVYGT